jgi:glycosyltransferase involved in cell wall biosynthesis
MEQQAPRALEAECDNSPVRVSYFVVTKNRAPYLRRALANVREFVKPQDELIVIDGGSTDGTVELVQQNRDIVSVFVSEPDSGEGQAVNKALFLARGRFLKCLTDDDYFYPDAMRQLVAAGEAHPELDFIYTNGEMWIETNGKPQFTQFFIERRDGVRTSLRRDIVGCGLGFFVRRRTLFKTGGISPGYASVDGDWHCKLIEAGCRIKYLDVNLYRWTGYSHSGAMAHDKMAFSHWMMALRLKKWKNFYAMDPPLAASVAGIDKLPEGLSFQYAIYLAFQVWRSKARILLRPLAFCVRSVRRLGRAWRRLTRRLPWKHRNSTLRFSSPEASLPFTGELY